MLYLHSSFNLAEGIRLEDYTAALQAFTVAMKSRNLLVDTGPILKRCQHPVMDTDDQRDHQFFFVMSFASRAQCDAAVQHILSADPDSDAAHRAIYQDIINPIFSCWENSA
jgi:hypothetical protein